MLTAEHESSSAFNTQYQSVGTAAFVPQLAESRAQLNRLAARILSIQKHLLTQTDVLHNETEQDIPHIPPHGPASGLCIESDHSKGHSA